MSVSYLQSSPATRRAARKGTNRRKWTASSPFKAIMHELEFVALLLVGAQHCPALLIIGFETAKV